MANLPSVGQYINDLEVSADAPLTEALFEKIGSTENYLLDQNTARVADIANLQTQQNGKLTEVWTGPSSFLATGVGVTVINNILTITGQGKRATVYFVGGRFAQFNGGVSLTLDNTQVAAIVAPSPVLRTVYQYTSGSWVDIVGGVRANGYAGIEEALFSLPASPIGVTYNTITIGGAVNAVFRSGTEGYANDNGGLLMYTFFAATNVNYNIGILTNNFGVGGGASYDRVVFRITY